MTRENAAKLWPIIKAYGEGKIVQGTDGDKWNDLDNPRFDSRASTYRIKPEPKTVPLDASTWTATWVRHKLTPNRIFAVSAIELHYITIGVTGYTFVHAAESLECADSPQGPWRPCTREVEE